MTQVRKNRYVAIPIFNDEYYVAFCCGGVSNLKRTLRIFRYPPEVISQAEKEVKMKRGLTYLDRYCTPVIFMPNPPKTPEQIGTLAHEAVHACIQVMRQVGETESDELLEVSVGAVVRHVLTKLPKLLVDPRT